MPWLAVVWTVQVTPRISGPSNLSDVIQINGYFMSSAPGGSNAMLELLRDELIGGIPKMVPNRGRTGIRLEVAAYRCLDCVRFWRTLNRPEWRPW